MTKKVSNIPNVGIIIALVISLVFNAVIILSALYFVSSRPLELSAGDYFIAKGLDPVAIQVDGREYNCVKPELVKEFTARSEKICYGVVAVDQNNQEVKQ